MKTKHLLHILAVLTALTLPLSAQSGGSLTPPGGAPAPSMKSLDEIEARTAISTLPFTISTAGSYYLTKSLSSTTDGITITANNVTLDLNGFTLNGSGTSSSYEGIRANGTTGTPLQNIAISNGVITGFGYSVYFNYVNNSFLTQLRCSGSAFDSITLTGQSSGQCDGNTVSHCNVSNCRIGIYLTGYSGQCDGNSVINCRVSNSSNIGISLTGGGSSGQCDGNSLINCHVSNSSNAGIQLSGSTSGQCNGNTVSNCKVSNAAFSGIYLTGSSGQCNGNTVNNSNFSNSGGTGIALTGVSSGQCDGNTVSHCRSSNSGAQGISLTGVGGKCNGNTVSHCNVSNFGDTGIYLENGFAENTQCDGNQILGNTVRGGQGGGIILSLARYCRIEGNHVSGVTASETSSYGIVIVNFGGRNLVVKNSCFGQDINFELDSDDTNGPVVNLIGTLPDTATAGHPWANFSN